MSRPTLPLLPLTTGTELRRFRRGLLPKAAVVAMICVPLLYGALYLWAYWDPTGNLDRLPVALVNEDRGATVDGERLHAGDDVVAELRESGALDWRDTDATTAEAGVRDGDYYFAVTIPASFSADIASASGDDPEQAELDVTYNDANSYLASTLGRSAMTQVRQAVSATIGEQAVDQVLVGLGSAKDGFAQASDGAITLQAATGDLSTGAHQLADGAGSAAAGAATLADGADRLAGGIAQADDGAEQVASGAATLSSGAADAAAGAGTLADGAGRLAAGASEAAGNATTLADGAAQVSAGVDQAAASLSGLSEVAGSVAGLTTALEDLQATLTQVAEQNAADGDTATAQALEQAGQALEQAGHGLQQQVTGLDPAAATQALTALTDGAHRLRDGTAALSDGLGTLSGSAGELATGAQGLTDGTGQVASGAASLATASGTLADGTGELADGVGTLTAGAHDLADGTSPLATGATQLADGADQLGGGSGELATSLSDAADQVPADDDATRTTRASTIATPVWMATTDVAAANGYGEGFAPFFIPLALFVGSLITWLLLRPLPPRGLATPAAGWRTAVAGYLPALAIGVAQSVVLLTVVHFGLGLGWSTALGTAAFTVLVAAAFLAVQQMLIALLGPAAGKVAVIALLMLQLTSSSGTYPVETTPGFFQAINPYVPMTYAVTGLRQLLTGGVDARLWVSVAALLAFTVGSLAVTSWRAGRLRTWSMSRLHPALTI